MALKKDIELENGIVVSYHRIVSVNKITNQETIIEVGSYINKEQREKEQEAISSKTPTNVFISTAYVIKPYDEESEIKELYDYLKTVEKFEGAANI